LLSDFASITDAQGTFLSEVVSVEWVKHLGR
jgi:hypothetical protein